MPVGRVVLDETINPLIDQAWELLVRLTRWTPLLPPINQAGRSRRHLLISMPRFIAAQAC